MARADALRKEAERKRMMAQSIEEAEYAQNLRNQAAQAEQRAQKLASDAKGDEIGEVIGGIIGVIVLIVIGFWIFG
ncbi:hypothetical protein [Lentibacter sp. XHP0401]|jgi:hypothetical protein|uniref:hypothetical protein n=1 Tax=Lentibacter sp. XHP0401 TaxID=2984334 RepID=UPI0021E79CB4|nr:hypothetical protein [Lentibacter sp. XHP0401]MCV2893636.1 hypothetical protein [Lentibacter sp. XHP0401]